MPKVIDRIRSQLITPDSQHRQIVFSFFWLTLFVFLGKVAGGAKEMAIAWRYGVSEIVDGYVLIFNLINPFIGLWWTLMTTMLMPIVTRLRQTKPGDLVRFSSELFGLTLVLGISLGVLAWIGIPVLLRSDFLGLSSLVQNQALMMVDGLVLLFPIGLVISLFSAIVLANGQHRNTLFEAIPALTILTILLIPTGYLEEPLIWGTVAGVFLHMSALGILLYRMDALQMPSFGFRAKAWQGFWSNIVIMISGQIFMSSSYIVDQVVASDLGLGALSTLSYANRIMALILGLGATAIGRATLPVFSEVHHKSRDDLIPLGLRWVYWIFALGCVISIAGWLGAPWGVSILFERGKFTHEASEEVASLLRYFMMQVPFYYSQFVLMSILTVKKQYLAIAIGGIVTFLSKIICVIPLVEHLQLHGLALSTVVMYVSSFGFYTLFLNRLRRC